MHNRIPFNLRDQIVIPISASEAEVTTEHTVVMVLLDLETFPNHGVLAVKPSLRITVPADIWREGDGNIDQRLKQSAIDEVRKALTLRLLETNGLLSVPTVTMKPKKPTSGKAAPASEPQETPAKPSEAEHAAAHESSPFWFLNAIGDAIPRVGRRWVRGLLAALDTVDGRPEGSVPIGVSRIPQPFPYGPGRAAFESWFSPENDEVRRNVERFAAQKQSLIDEQQKRIEHLEKLGNTAKRTESSRLVRIATQLNKLSGVALPEGGPLERLVDWIIETQKGLKPTMNDSTGQPSDVDAQLAAALQVATDVYAALGIVVPRLVLVGDDSVASIAKRVADATKFEVESRSNPTLVEVNRLRRIAAKLAGESGAATEILPADASPDVLERWIASTLDRLIKRRDEDLAGATHRIERIASEVERVSGESFGILVRTEPLLEDCTIRAARRMRKRIDMLDLALKGARGAGLKPSEMISAGDRVRGLHADAQAMVSTEMMDGADRSEITENVVEFVANALDKGDNVYHDELDPTELERAVIREVGYKHTCSRAHSWLDLFAPANPGPNPYTLMDHPGKGLEERIKKLGAAWEAAAKASLGDLFDTLELYWDNHGGVPMAFPAIRSLYEPYIIGIIDGDAVVVESRIASIEFAQDTRLPLSKRWASQPHDTSARFVIHKHNISTVRTNTEGKRTRVVVVLELIPHEEPHRTSKTDTTPEPSPTDVPAAISATFSDERNEILTILNLNTGHIVRIMGRIEDTSTKQAGAKPTRMLHGAVRGERRHVQAAINALDDMNGSNTYVTIKRLKDAGDVGVKAMIVSGEVKTAEFASLERVVTEDVIGAFVSIELETEPFGTGNERLKDNVIIEDLRTGEKFMAWGHVSQAEEPDEDGARPWAALLSLKGPRAWVDECKAILSRVNETKAPVSMTVGFPIHKKHVLRGTLENTSAGPERPGRQAGKDAVIVEIFTQLYETKAHPAKPAGTGLQVITIENPHNGETIMPPSGVWFLGHVSEAPDEANGSKTWSLHGQVEGTSERVSECRTKLEQLSSSHEPVLVRIETASGPRAMMVQFFGANIGPDIHGKNSVLVNVFVSLVEVKTEVAQLAETQKTAKQSNVEYSCAECSAQYVIDQKLVTGKEALVRCRVCGDFLWVRGDGTTTPHHGPTTRLTVETPIFANPQGDPRTPCGFPHESGIQCRRTNAECRPNVPHEGMLPDQRIVGFTWERSGLFVKPTGEEVRWRPGQFTRAFVERPLNAQSTVKFQCGTCRRKYTVAHEKVAGRSIKIRCANCGSKLEVSATGAAVIEHTMIVEEDATVGTDASYKCPEPSHDQTKGVPAQAESPSATATFKMANGLSRCSMVIDSVQRDLGIWSQRGIWKLRGTIDGPAIWAKSGAGTLQMMNQSKEHVELRVEITGQPSQTASGRVAELKMRPAQVLPHPTIPEATLTIMNVEATFLESAQPSPPRNGENDRASNSTGATFPLNEIDPGELITDGRGQLFVTTKHIDPNPRGGRILVKVGPKGGIGTGDGHVRHHKANGYRIVELGSKQHAILVGNPVNIIDLPPPGQPLVRLIGSKELLIQTNRSGEFVVIDGVVRSDLTISGTINDMPPHAYNAWQHLKLVAAQPSNYRVRVMDAINGCALPGGYHITNLEFSPNRYDSSFSGDLKSVTSVYVQATLKPAGPEYIDGPTQFEKDMAANASGERRATMLGEPKPSLSRHSSAPKADTPNELGLGVLFEAKDLAPVTPRSERDPDDKARIEAQPKNLRTLVEEAHRLLSEFEPAMSVLEMAYTLTVKGQPVDPLLHRIKLLGNAWKATNATMARILHSHNTKPIVDPEEMAIYHRVAQLLTGHSFETHLLVQPGVRMYFNALRTVLTEVHVDKWAGMSIVLDMLGKPKTAQGTAEPIGKPNDPELLFRGRSVKPTDPEWKDLIAYLRSEEEATFPIQKLVVTPAGVAPIKATASITIDGKDLDLHAVNNADVKGWSGGSSSPVGLEASKCDDMARMRPEDDETQAALNNVEALLGTLAVSKEPEPQTTPNEPPAQIGDLEPGDSVLVVAVDDAFYGMVGEFEGREDDGRYRVRFVKHGGVGIRFSRSEIEKQPRPEMPKLNLTTSLQPDPSASPPITEAEVNMARKLDEHHQQSTAAIAGSARSPYGPGFWEQLDYPPTGNGGAAPLSSITEKDQLAARARDLAYAPGEPGVLRRTALAEMAAKDPQIAEDAAIVAALVGDPMEHVPAEDGKDCVECEPTSVFAGPLPAPGPMVIIGSAHASPHIHNEPPKVEFYDPNNPGVSVNLKFVTSAGDLVPGGLRAIRVGDNIGPKGSGLATHEVVTAHGVPVEVTIRPIGKTETTNVTLADLHKDWELGPDKPSGS
ncbi:hypothetical protein EKK58_05195 [Candidatus Dependentiae bacterium]|nr:MAG: hypothetical protein EKK58_05195 [Candidatus Dependentiae bacterium]